jgi:lysophospholipase L1-like esterase
LRNLDDIVRELKSANPSTRIFIGTLVGMWPQTAPDGKMGVPWWVEHHHLAPAQAAAYVGELNDQLRGFAASHGAYVIDLAKTFEPLDRTRLQWDFAHMYQDGYELMAWSMLDALRDAGMVSVKPSGRHQALLAAYRTVSSPAQKGDVR